MICFRYIGKSLRSAVYLELWMSCTNCYLPTAPPSGMAIIINPKLTVCVICEACVSEKIRLISGVSPPVKAAPGGFSCKSLITDPHMDMPSCTGVKTTSLPGIHL